MIFFQNKFNISKQFKYQTAIMDIAKIFDQMELSLCTHPVIKWLGQYDGIEDHFNDDNYPVLQVRDYLAAHAKIGSKLDLRIILDGLAQLPFTFYRVAASITRRRWNPLVMSLHEFERDITAAQEGKLMVWEGEDPAISSDMTVSYLLTKIMQLKLNS